MVLTMLWWGRTDSNHRSESQQIYSLPPLATRESILKPFVIIADILENCKCFFVQIYKGLVEDFGCHFFGKTLDEFVEIW